MNNHPQGSRVYVCMYVCVRALLLVSVISEWVERGGGVPHLQTVSPLIKQLTIRLTRNSRTRRTWRQRLTFPLLHPHFNGFIWRWFHFIQSLFIQRYLSKIKPPSCSLTFRCTHLHPDSSQYKHSLTCRPLSSLGRPLQWASAVDL